ncbi:MAG: alpha/beta fold hydrolase [Thermoanaerobaculia bacterium]
MSEGLSRAEGLETAAISSLDGTIIYCDIRPADPRGTLIVPGFWRTRRWPTMRILTDRIAATGRAVAALDLRGHGDSGGRFTFGEREWEDVAAVAEELVRRGWTSIDVIGFSLGGAAAVSAVARRPDLPWRSLLLVSAVADLALVRPRLNPFTAHRHLTFSQAFRAPRIDWRSLRRPRPRAVDDIANVSVPVTVVHVIDDWLVHHSHGEALHAHARDPKRMVLLEIPGRWHADRILTAAAEAIDPLLDELFGRK